MVFLKQKCELEQIYDCRKKCFKNEHMMIKRNQVKIKINEEQFRNNVSYTNNSKLLLYTNFWENLIFQFNEKYKGSYLKCNKTIFWSVNKNASEKEYIYLSNNEALFLLDFKNYTESYNMLNHLIETYFLYKDKKITQINKLDVYRDSNSADVFFALPFYLF